MPPLHPKLPNDGWKKVFDGLCDRDDGSDDANVPVTQANVGQQIPKFLSLRAIDGLLDTNVPIVQTIC